MFNSVLRAQLSLSWIVGPPLAYFLADQFGFTFMYAASATIFAVSIIIVLLMLPQAVSSEKHFANDGLREEGIVSNRKAVILLSFSCLFISICNAMMFINMPIYLSENLGLSDRLAGILMGTAAGIEIPVMLIAGYCTRFISKKTLMLISIVAGASYYVGLFLAKTEIQLIAIQLFNGIFVGIFASIGMLYFQDLMPYKMGTATTLFTNTGSASWVLAGPIAGLVANQFGYQSTWLIAILFCFIALGFMLFVRKI